MAILLDANTRVICQGMTGRAGSFHTARMLAYGTRVVGGVTPGRGRTRHLDLPMFDTVESAVAETGANASLIFVPSDRAADAMIEAIEAGLPLVVCVTERVPLIDMVRVKQALEGSRTRLVGPNSQGVLAPGVAQVGVMSTVHAKRGSIGIASRSASLTSEIVAQTTRMGLGQSTTVGVGGDPLHGLDLRACVELFLADPETRGIVVVGEIGGVDEERAAELIKRLKPDKPIVALVAGRNAPAERRMGHAGALATLGSGTASQKIDILRDAGVEIAPNASLVGETMRAALGRRRA
jgi:succinyl-CoA synthetase alpha subunit